MRPTSPSPQARVKSAGEATGFWSQPYTTADFADVTALGVAAGGGVVAADEPGAVAE
ncbi:hypothetical protein OG232_30730 [Streptomyces sp. NBC_01411]|uniref:hypothetical protein n=1 Tax=Streptomyces sp. NBC_01411 TaxID=2903857 RepID=UPI003248B30F